jgi:N-acetylglucosamine kinase-like BadF-type ATPase
MSSLVFGADGGGTKTLGLICDQEGRIRGHGTAGASNPNVVGITAAAETLYDLIRRCCNEAGCAVSDLRALVLGLAGAGLEKNRTQLHERLVALAGQELPIVIETDARVALEGAFNGGSGILILAGTGSVVIGKTLSGEVVMAGGWGRILGDEGSGYWLGREVLKSLTVYYDGRGGSQMLAEMVGKEFGLNSRERIIAAIYQEEFAIPDIAPLAMRAAEEGDAVALEILTRGVGELMNQVEYVASHLRHERTISVALFGGVAEQPLYAAMLKSNIERRIRNATTQAPLNSAERGAILMALREATKLK